MMKYQCALLCAVMVESDVRREDPDSWDVYEKTKHAKCAQDYVGTE
jgi:hypothetical protein